MVLFRIVIYYVLATGILFVTPVSTAQPQKLQGGIVQSFPGIDVIDGNVQAEAIYGHAEIISCMETELNVQIEWQSLPTDRLLKLTRENQLDLIYPMGYTEKRNSYLQASVWLTQDDDFFVFKAGAVLPESLAQGQVSKLTVGVKRGSPQQDYLQKHGFENVHQVYDYQQLLPLLKMDRVEMLAIPQTLAEQLQMETAADSEQHNLQLYNYYTRDAGFYLAPSLANTHLEQFNNAVIQCRQHAKTVTAIK